MPLSENEQRQLEAIERALAVEDPKFAATLHGSDLRTHTLRRLRRSIALFALGLALLACVFVTPWLAAAGAALMFVGLLGIVAATKRLSGHEASTPSSVLDIQRPDLRGPSSRRPSGGRQPRERGRWRERVEERWRRRWDETDD